MRLIQFCPAVSLLCSCLFILGCSAYRLGSPSEIPFDSIYIEPPLNSSFVPQAQQLLGTQIRKAIIRDGRVSLLSNPDEATARLEIELMDYRRNSSAYNSDDIDVARSYALTLFVKVSLWDARKNAYLFKDLAFQASEQSYLGNPYDNSVISANNFNAAEYNSIPLLTRSLAEKISDHVLSPW